MNGLWVAAERMCECIAEILAGCAPSIYLYGSAALDDFRPGWSDVDLLVLTREEISEAQAERLVGLRQELLAQEAFEPWRAQRARAFQSGEKPLRRFGQRIKKHGRGGEHRAHLREQRCPQKGQ